MMNASLYGKKLPNIKILREGILACILLIILTACNNPGSAVPGADTSVSLFDGNNTALLPTGNAVDILTLVKVVRSNRDPNSIIELIGQDDEIGRICKTTKGCNCRFDFVGASGLPQTVSQPPSHVELNMMRCLFTQVTANSGSGTTYFDVRVELTANPSSVSNAYRMFLTGVNPSLDPSIASNYLPVHRFQCRDIFREPTAFYKGIIDPRLWDLSQAYNFFTTSLGRDYGAVKVGEAKFSAKLAFECPAIPNDSADNTAYDIRLFSIAPINLNNIGQVDLATGDVTIYPSDDNLGLNATSCLNQNEPACEKYKINRHDFYLSIFQDGIFKIPFCGIHRVSNYMGNSLKCAVDASKGSVVLGSSALADTGEDIIGFAAVPNSNQRCPDTNALKIPTGKKWAKVWRFRTSLTARQIEDVINKDDVSELLCTNRNKECLGFFDETTGSPSSVCWNTTGTGGNPGGIGDVGALISSLLPGGGGIGFGNCSSAGVTGDNHTPPTMGYAAPGASCSTGGTNCCQDNGANAVGIANYTPGGDWCNPALTGANDASQSGGLAHDIWLIGINPKAQRKACIEADTDANGLLPYTAMPDPLNSYVLQTTPLETDSRADYVYIVTPENVTTETMQDPNNAVTKQYTPRRYVSPDNAQPVTYMLSLGSENTATPLERVSKFPLCILQDTK